MKLMMLVPMLVVGVLAVTATSRAEEAAGASTRDGKGTLYHVVHFKFKPDATEEKIQAVEEAFAALKGKIEGVRSLDWGTNVSPEGRDKGFTHCFILTYDSEVDRDAYLKHPEHQAFVKLLKSILADALVIDFWSKK